MPKHGTDSVRFAPGPIRMATASRHDPANLDPTCMACRFWDNEERGAVATGTCRRNPPGGGFWRPEGHRNDWIGANWPETLYDDWCGEFDERVA